MAATAITGTPPFLRAEVRHDGRLLAPWALLTTLLASSSMLYPLIFPTDEDRSAFAAAVGSNPAMAIIFGPAFDLSTTDGFAAWRSLALGGLIAALGVIFAVTRATRAQEDSGQAELLASGVMARLMAAVWMCLVFAIVLGLVTGLVTVAFGGGWNATMLLAATMTATAWMFTGVAAVTAQLGSDARTANSLAVATLGVLFIARGVTYALDAPDWVIWINPLGWMTETKPAVENDWWPLLAAVALTVALLVVAFVLQARREFGAGAIAPRPGPARGRDRSTWRLALRLNRGPMLSWTIAFIALGLVFGYLATSVTDILGGDAALQQMLAAGAVTDADLVGAFVVTILSLVGIIASIPGVQTMLKVRAEELDDRLEPIIATATAPPRRPGRVHAGRRHAHGGAGGCRRCRRDVRRRAAAGCRDRARGVDRRRALGRGGRREAARRPGGVGRRARLVRADDPRSHVQPVGLGARDQPVLARAQRHQRGRGLVGARLDQPRDAVLPHGRLRRVPAPRPRHAVARAGERMPRGRRVQCGSASGSIARYAHSSNPSLSARWIMNPGASPMAMGVSASM